MNELKDNKPEPREVIESKEATNQGEQGTEQLDLYDESTLWSETENTNAEPTNATESTEVAMQPAEQGIEQLDLYDESTLWSETENINAEPTNATEPAEVLAQPAEQDVSDALTFDRYMEQAKDLDVSTDRDKAVFYSGPDPVYTENPYPGTKKPEGQNDDIARSYAEQTGKTTLEMTPGGQWFEREVKDNPNFVKVQEKQLAATLGREPSVEEIADFVKVQKNQLAATLSQRFAEGASGEVVAFSRPDPSDPRRMPNSTWTQIELPALKTNPNVTKIDEV